MSDAQSKPQRQQPELLVILRALEAEDLGRIHGWHNDSRLYESLTGTFHYVSRSTVEEWLRQRQAPSQEQVSLAICERSNSQHIGNIYLQNIDWIARHAELAIFIGSQDHRSKGYGQAAVRLLLDYAFRELNLRRVLLYVLADNEPAIHVYEKCGFQVEGRLPSHVYKCGSFKDVLIMGVCAGEHLSKQG
jgi:RimJ/RimL family protein N-acetyltransferase